MIRPNLNLSACLLFAFAAACGGDDMMTGTTDSGTGTESESTTTARPTDSDSDVTDTASSGTDSDSDSESTTNPTDPTDATTDTTATTTGTDICEGVEKKDAGGECSEDCECKLITNLDPVGPPSDWDITYDDTQDGKCFSIPVLGGLCGECVNSDDCDGGGCTIPNPLASAPSYCNDGSAGAGCDINGPNTCMDGLSCGVILDAQGLLTVATCGECSTSGDCADPTPFCAPEINVAGFTGELSCVAPASIPNNTACVIGEDDACMSGVCSVATVMAVIQVGICGECHTDDDCPMGTTCTDASVDIENLPPDPLNPPPDYMPLIGSVCE